jgi:hypothetical protein
MGAVPQFSPISIGFETARFLEVWKEWGIETENGLTAQDHLTYDNHDYRVTNHRELSTHFLVMC